MKKCSKCKQIKKESEFGKDKYQSSGLTCQCKLCRTSFKKQKRETDWRYKQMEKNYRIKRSLDPVKRKQDYETRKKWFESHKRTKYWIDYYHRKKEIILNRRKIELGDYVVYLGSKFQVIDIQKGKGAFIVGNKLKIRIAKYKLKKYIPKKYNY